MPSPRRPATPPRATTTAARCAGRTSRGALAQWEQALTLQPADDLRMQVLTQIARARDDSSDVTGAEAAFREALALNRRLPRRVAESALDYVRFLQRQARPAEAAALVDEVVGWNPWAPEARVEKARLLADAGKWPEVVVEGEFVLANAGGSRSLQRAAHLLLARAYYRMQQPEKPRRIGRGSRPTSDVDVAPCEDGSSDSASWP